MNEITDIPGSPLEGKIRQDWIPANRWTDPELFQLEKERLWPRTWHQACREEDIPNVGDYVTYEVLDESIILVRTAKDKISAYYNVCQHRGRRLVNPGKGHTRGFFCNFHGWKWNLQGENTFVFNEDEWRECPLVKSEIALKSPGAVNPLWTPSQPTMDPSHFVPARDAQRYGGGSVAKLRSGLCGHSLCFPYWGDPSPS